MPALFLYEISQGKERLRVLRPFGSKFLWLGRLVIFRLWGCLVRTRPSKDQGKKREKIDFKNSISVQKSWVPSNRAQMGLDWFELNLLICWYKQCRWRVNVLTTWIKNFFFSSLSSISGKSYWLIVSSSFIEWILRRIAIKNKSSCYRSSQENHMTLTVCPTAGW